MKNTQDSVLILQLFVSQKLFQNQKFEKCKKIKVKYGDANNLFFFFSFLADPAEIGSSQARGQI